MIDLNLIPYDVMIIQKVLSHICTAEGLSSFYILIKQINRIAMLLNRYFRMKKSLMTFLYCEGNFEFRNF